MNTNGNDNLIAVPQGEIMSSDIVNQIALRLQKTYQPPKKRNSQSEQEYNNNVVQAADFPIVVELAMAQGHNPLSKTFHYWKQDGRIMVDDHYAPLMNWAQSKGAFTYETETLGEDEKVALEGVEANDYVVRFRAMRRADQGARQALFKTILEVAISSGKPFDDALIIAETTADRKFAVISHGVVKYAELHYKDNSGKWVLNVYATPKGWIPGVTRAEVRAIRNGIKKMVGVPMPEERRRLGMEISMPELAQIAAEMPPQIAAESGDVRERYMRLEAQNKHLQAIVEALPEGELSVIAADNNNLLYGKKEEAINGEIYDDPFDTTQDAPFPVQETNKVAESTRGLEGGVDEDYAKETIAIEAEKAEYASRIVSTEDAYQIALDSGYKGDIGIIKAVKALLARDISVGNNKIDLSLLSDIELWNFVQYAQRRAILVDTNLPIEYRLSQIPEIESAINKPKTIKDAGEFLHRVLRLLTAAGKKFERLETQKVDA